MNNDQIDRGIENPNHEFALMTEGNHEKTTVRLVGTGIWTRDLPNASLLRYHGATSLGHILFSWILLAAYSRTKLKSIGYSASPCLRPQWIGEALESFRID